MSGFALPLFLLALIQDPGLEHAREEARKELRKVREKIEKTQGPGGPNTPPRSDAGQDQDPDQPPQPEVTLEDLLRLEERFEKRLQELERRLETVNRTASMNVFNPQITVFGNFAARGDNRRVHLDNTDPGSERIDDSAFFRTAEVDFRAAIDPYAEGVLIVAIEGLAEEGFEAEIEEGYIVLKRIPILESAPGGIKVKAGKFRPPFGVSNRLHLHDMPHITRPLVVPRYLGGEQNEFFEAGLAPVGVDVHFFLPEFWDALTIEVHLDALESGETALTEDNDPRNPAYLGHANFFFRLGDPTTFNLGVTQYREHGTLATRINGVDATFVWRPDQFGSIVTGFELIWADREFFSGGGIDRNTPVGGYFYVQVQSSANWYFGVRYDQVEDPADDELSVEVLGGYISYYTSEFLRIRVGAENRNSDDIPEEDDINTFMIEFNFVFGAHPVEPYWVNR